MLGEYPLTKSGFVVSCESNQNIKNPWRVGPATIDEIECHSLGDCLAQNVPFGLIIVDRVTIVPSE